MNNLSENIIASIIAAVLSGIVVLLLQAFGVSAQYIVLLALLVLVLLFVVARGFFPVCTRWLTERLLENALQLDANKTDITGTAFKKKIVERVLLESSEVEPKRNSSIVEYLNQVTCEANICEAFRKARKVKILTIRGEKYFSGDRSLLYKLYSEKRTKNFTIEVLVLSSENEHVTDELAKDMGQDSAEEIKGKMHIVLESLKRLANQNKNFEVKCYDETPNFKILLFDDIMFVSAYTEPKNDHNAKMLQITRNENPLFTGLERYFDNLSKRSVSPQ